MKVYKFGGASTADAARMRALLPVIQSETEPLLVVMSALGKITNALENVLNNACRNHRDIAAELAEQVIQEHTAYTRALLNDEFYDIAMQKLEPLFAELRAATEGALATRYDWSYDQIVCVGELFSSCMFHHFLLQHGLPVHWVDVRKVVRTDDTYRDAVIDWNRTKLEAEAIIGRNLSYGNIVITQGFIGSSDSGDSVTLGREGSDYTAAVLAAMLNADSATIWKDVDGFRNADPKQFSDTVRIEKISYAEVIELAFYGAQIIHPKTIKPLHNANIPLYVKCFLNKDLIGSVITGGVVDVAYPPMIVLKENQVLVQVTTRDFSFITEDNLSHLYRIFHDLKVKINLIQNAAISFIACINNRDDKVRALIAELSNDYIVALNNDVSILTVRHYKPELIFALTKGQEILLRQETSHTMQVVMK